MKTAYEDSTVLTLGARGRLGESTFTLVGRTCVRGRRGSTWNEWTARFDDGTTVFLAESGGAFTVYEEGSITPSFGALTVDANVDTGFVVVERGQATRVARWGEVEDAPTTYAYADLSSRTGTRATIDFGRLEQQRSVPRVFVGRKTTLRELGLTPRAEPPRFIAAHEVSRPKGVELWLEVGDEGMLAGARSRVIGAISRSMGTTDRVRWDEYVLHDAHDGLRWLVLADGHWSLVETVEAGLVHDAGSTGRLDGREYQLVSEGRARVEWATGELPWEVAIGDESSVKELVHPTHGLLTKEWTDNEVSWSRGRWIATNEIARAFDKRVLPKPIGRAPHQPDVERPEFEKPRR